MAYREVDPNIDGRTLRLAAGPLRVEVDQPVLPGMVIRRLATSRSLTLG